MITSEQIKAARMLLGWDQPELARQAGVGVATIRRVEGIRGAAQGSETSLRKIVAAIEDAGVRFLAANKNEGEGVRKIAKVSKHHE